jgi:hypothetical protein
VLCINNGSTADIDTNSATVSLSLDSSTTTLSTSSGLTIALSPSSSQPACTFSGLFSLSSSQPTSVVCVVWCGVTAPSRASGPQD